MFRQSSLESITWFADMLPTAYLPLRTRVFSICCTRPSGGRPARRQASRMRHQHHSSSQHTCGRGRRNDTVRFHVGTPEGTRTLPLRFTSDCGDRVRSPHGGPYSYLTLPGRSTFEGRTGAPSARLPGASLRHGWRTRTNPPRAPLNVPLPSAAGLLSPLLYSKRRQAPVAIGWGRLTKVARLSRWPTGCRS